MKVAESGRKIASSVPAGGPGIREPVPSATFVVGPNRVNANGSPASVSAFSSYPTRIPFMASSLLAITALTLVLFVSVGLVGYVVFGSGE